MNTHKQANIFCKAKAGRQCFFLILCFHLALGEVPGPCRHSVTKDHLQKIKRLIENQLQNDCSVTYTFTERQSLSKVCYVKAAFPQVLELLNTRFQYAQNSDNYHYVLALKNLVLNIYSQKCIPEINEELEDNPVRFMKEYSSSLRETLEKIREVIQLYMELMTENNKPVDWNCEEEYAEDYPEFTTTIAQTTGATECHCSCPTLGHGTSEQMSLLDTSLWNDLPEPSFFRLHSSLPTRPPKTPMATMSPWDRQSTLREYKNHGRSEAAASSTPSIKKEDKEEMNGNIISSTKLALHGTAGFESEPASAASSDEENGDPKDTRELHSDETPPFSTSAESVQNEHDFADSIGPESGGSPSMVSSSLVQSPTQKAMSASTSGQSAHHTFLSLHHMIISSPKKSMDFSTTPIPFLQAAFESTPNKQEESTAVVVAKRSLEPGAEGFQTDSGTDAQLPQSWIPTSPPLGTSVSRETAEEMTVPTNTIGLGSQRAANRMDSDSLSEQPVEDSGMDFQNGTWGGSLISYKTAFIVASVCGGLLLIINLYCFKEQRKLKALLHSSRISETQRLTSNGTDIEMQLYETNQSGLASS
ncbi:macrophage colony-stimulating factor 1a isoform X2 [Megalops cyprinoides]|uniref:macrophage colony-stimulating factor 1a isoform X2 n=1 Tax=Megalops cyprinoides TaxID=118141 RepID=UPI001864AB0D|nr:macrophage colony-stimulating factor 1a isoform X2 [Megalops cyprinoides]